MRSPDEGPCTTRVEQFVAALRTLEQKGTVVAILFPARIA
jgi:hypothetical protein